MNSIRFDLMFWVYECETHVIWIRQLLLIYFDKQVINWIIREVLLSICLFFSDAAAGIHQNTLLVIDNRVKIVSVATPDRLFLVSVQNEITNVN